MAVYYNEFDPYAAQWLRNLIAKGLIPDGEVDERSITEVEPVDLDGFVQCHFFAGIGGWSHALRLAGWSDDRPIWTGSCPCQPFSAAGKQKGQADERHLWPEFYRLIRARRPAVVMGEQVAAAVGKYWLDGVFDDLEGAGYACGAVIVPACSVDAPHRRDRLWFVADADTNGREQLASSRLHDQGQPRHNADGRGGYARCDMGDADGTRSEARLPASNGRCEGDAEVSDDGSRRRLGAWGEHHWHQGADGKTRRIKSGIPLLAHGVPARVGRLRAYGNAIVPQVAAEVIAAYMER